MLEDNGLQKFARRWLPRIEDEIALTLQSPEEITRDHYGMMRYQMGWVDESFRPGSFPRGKQIRPLLCLMAAEEVGCEPERALPAAAALEILHNFSLVHDDIEDEDERRRHRPTLWTVWGRAQGINAGDGMFALAYEALLRSRERGVASETLVAALGRFTRTCVSLTEGQHLDLKFEERNWLTIEDYLRMIQGKTASLLGASLSLGALMAGADAKADEAFHRFGLELGMAFQIRDDLLGIWGDPTVTGKAAGNDILRRKKSLPLLVGLHHPRVGPRLQALLALDPEPDQVAHVLELLAQAGAGQQAEELLKNYHRRSLEALEEAVGSRSRRSLLHGLAAGLVEREA